jgi:hypothetical protein
VNWSAALVALVPEGVTTLMSTVPAPAAGDVAMTWLALTVVTLIPATPPKVTELTPVKFDPVIVTGVPPNVDPVPGETELTTGAVSYVNRSEALVGLVPAGVVTWTSTIPVPAGVVAVIRLEFATATLVAATPPKVTEVAPVKFEPKTVTEVPPAGGPPAGTIPVTVGGGPM